MYVCVCACVCVNAIFHSIEKQRYLWYSLHCNALIKYDNFFGRISISVCKIIISKLRLISPRRHHLRELVMWSIVDERIIFNHTHLRVLLGVVASGTIERNSSLEFRNNFWILIETPQRLLTICVNEIVLCDMYEVVASTMNLSGGRWWRMLAVAVVSVAVVVAVAV